MDDMFSVPNIVTRSFKVVAASHNGQYGKLSTKIMDAVGQAVEKQSIYDNACLNGDPKSVTDKLYSDYCNFWNWVETMIHQSSKSDSITFQH